jgi:hypothetical protein
MALDELPSSIFSGNEESESADAPIALEDERLAEAYLLYSASPRYDALPALLATPHGLSQGELAALCRVETLIAALQLSSQLARNSEKYYSMLSNVFTAQKLVWILTQPSRTARAKCCNLIGNLCRHSGNFYKIFSTPVDLQRLHHRSEGPSSGSQVCTVLSVLSAYCADPDPSTRKFASFAGTFHF